MLLGISQPTFIPWIGYFAFLEKIDKLIFLDDVQFEKRSWQQRNYIKLNFHKHLLTVPVKSKGKFHQKISEVKILNNKNLLSIQNKIYHAYKNATFFKNYYQDIIEIFNKKHDFLLDLNIELIKFFTKILDIRIEFDFSSKYEINLKKEKLIFELCKLNRCRQYLTTIGSKNYLEGFDEIPDTNIKISYYEYRDVCYSQLGGEFLPKMSIIDLLFNEGKNSINIIREGFKII
jgi:hypothetical protein